MAESGGHSMVAQGYIGIHVDTGGLRSDLAHAMEMFKESMSTMAEVAGGILAAAGIKGFAESLKEVAGDFLSVNAKFEQFEVTLTRVFHSAATAREIVEGVHELAAKTPLKMDSLIDATKSLKIFGFATKEILPLLATLGDAAAVFPEHANESMGKMITAFGRIKSSGVMTMREMRQLLMAHIPVWDILSLKMHKTTAQLQEMLKSQKLTAPIVLPLLQGGIKEKFGGMAAEIAGTWDGLMKILHQSWEYFVKIVGEPIFDVAKSGLESLVGWFHSEDAKAWMEKLQGAVKSLISLIKSGLDSPWLGVIKKIGLAVAEVSALAAVLHTAVEAAGTLGGLFAMISSPLAILSAGATLLASSFNEALSGPGGEQLTATLEEIWTLVAEITTNLQDGFKDFLAWLQSTWSSVFGDSLPKSTNAMWQGVLDWIKQAADLVSLLTSDFGLAWETIKVSAEIAFDSIKNTFIDVFNFMQSHLYGVIAAISEGFTGIGEYMMATFREVGKVAVAVWEGIKAVWNSGFDISNIPKVFGDAFSKALASQKDEKIPEIGKRMKQAYAEASTGVGIQNGPGDAARKAAQVGLRSRMDAIRGEMEAKRDANREDRDAAAKSKDFWAETKKRQQVLGRPADEPGDDEHADAGEKAKKQKKGKSSDFGITGVAEFAKQLQASLNKTEAESAAIETKDLLDGIIDEGKGIKIANFPPPPVATAV